MMYPLVYEGHSYVSARALAEALGATVKWNNDTQTVEVTTSGAPATAGMPDKDNSTGTTTPAAPAAAGSGFLAKLAADFTMETAQNTNKQQALAFMTIYANALKTGQTAELDAFLDASMLTPPDDQYWTGVEDTKESLRKKISGDRAANKQEILDDYAAAVSKMTVSNVESGSTYKSDLTANMQYYVRPEGFDAFSSLSVSLHYSVPYKHTEYYLENIFVQ
ncbi:stalk domain-containing protein [Paenibacillus xerothermodurans]|uniref:stalk domain-containing protein n=1 Tax=Paenibacillus xerothermodurans TaxID=1977292 RepID=UPI001FB4CCDC|nr:stalk domain-containing protein [Paenibacillus xerothermodurans]